MPCVSSGAGPWILQRLELKSIGGQPYLAPIFQEPLAISGDEVRHRSSLPAMSVEPQATVHREDHPITATFELSIRWR